MISRCQNLKNQWQFRRLRKTRRIGLILERGQIVEFAESRKHREVWGRLRANRVGSVLVPYPRTHVRLSVPPAAGARSIFWKGHPPNFQKNCASGRVLSRSRHHTPRSQNSKRARKHQLIEQNYRREGGWFRPAPLHWGKARCRAGLRGHGRVLCSRGFSNGHQFWSKNRLVVPGYYSLWVVV